MIAIHRLNIIWAVLALIAAAYNVTQGDNPLAMLVYLIIAGLPAAVKVRLPNLLVLMWWAFCALFIMVQRDRADYEAMLPAVLAFLIGVPVIARTLWWIVSGLIPKKL